jgi:hypothetical protein
MAVEPAPIRNGVSKLIKAHIRRSPWLKPGDFASKVIIDMLFAAFLDSHFHPIPPY